MEIVDENVSQMNKEALLNWLKEKFNEEIALKFDGKFIPVHLKISRGSSTQFSRETKKLMDLMHCF